MTVSLVMAAVAILLLFTGSSVAVAVHVAGLAGAAALVLDLTAAAIVAWAVVYALIGLAVLASGAGPRRGHLALAVTLLWISVVPWVVLLMS